MPLDDACGERTSVRPEGRAQRVTMMERGNPTQSGRMQGQASLVSFLWFGIPTTEERNSPGKAKQKPSAKLGNQLNSKSSSNT
ncbi:hypothetical protein HNP29_004142 [Pseudomonas alcaligenes]|nr:hypothetical protein [Pseudomonas alcaligenes]